MYFRKQKDSSYFTLFTAGYTRFDAYGGLVRLRKSMLYIAAWRILNSNADVS